MPFNHSLQTGETYRRSFLNIVMIGCLAALVIANILLAWVPPVSRDALTHHLAIPKLYLQNGGMFEIPYISFSYYPMNLDLLYMVPLYFGNDILPKLIHFAFALLTAWVVYGYLRRRLNRTYAFTGALLFLSTPVIIKLSITVYVDLGLIYFTTAAMLTLFRWIESGFELKYIIISAIFCGLALGTKYNGLVALCLFTLAIPVLVIRSSGGRANYQAKSLGWAALYLFVALLVFSPWMIRNYQWTGNPIFPLYKKVFKSLGDSPPEVMVAGSENEPAVEHKVSHWNHFMIRRHIYGESWLEIALLPVRIFFQGQDDTPKYFDGRLNPFLLLLALPAFAGIRRDPAHVRLEKYFMVVFVVLFIFISFLQAVIRIRYIAPIVPPLAILAMFGLTNLVTYVQGRERPVVRTAGLVLASVLIVVMFGMNGIYLISQFKKVAPFDYISGKVSRSEYIARHRPEYPVVAFANRTLGDDVKILGMFMGNRRYYCDRKLIFGETMMANAFLNARSVEDIRSLVRKKGFTHLIINYELYHKWAKGFIHGEGQIIDQFFTRNTSLLNSNGKYGLYSFTLNRS